MGEDQRRLLLILLVSSVVSAVYLGYVEWNRPPKTSPAPDGQRETVVPEPRPKATQPGAAAQPGPRAPGEGDNTGVAPKRSLTEAERRAREQVFTLRNEHVVATASTLTGALKDVRLTSERFKDEDGQHREMATANKALFPAYRLDVLGLEIPKDTVWEGEQLSATAVRFSTTVHGFEVARKIELGDGPYQFWSTVRITNRSPKKHAVRPVVFVDHYVLRAHEGGGMFAARSPEQSSALCVASDETIRILRDGDGAFAKHEFHPNVALAGVENTYFTMALVPHGALAESCRLAWFTSTDQATRPRFFGLLGSTTEPEGTLYRAELRYPRRELAAGESMVTRTLGYLGPKEAKSLAVAGHGLSTVIDRGWFSKVAEYLVTLLALIYGYVGNWGVAIILMTVFFKILFFPLTWKSFQSLAKMKVLKPEMDRINELYADDKEKKGVAVMELYRKHGVNPLGGCLPQLLQMPVWIAFFASLSTDTELYRARFALHWTDLSAPDSLFVLPLLVGFLIYVQQRMTPTTMDPAQAKVMLYFMPLMMTSVYLFMPSGLCLYSAANSVLTFAQQHFIFRQIDKRQEAALERARSEAPPADEAGAPAPEGAPTHSETRLSVPKGTTRRRVKRG